jgi:hypothetical protein
MKYLKTTVHKKENEMKVLCKSGINTRLVLGC